MPKRRAEVFHSGERAENKARAEAKKPITAKHSRADVLLNKLDPILPWQAAATTRLVHRMAHGDDDRAELLDALGLGEI